MLFQLLLFYNFSAARENSAYYQQVVASQNLTDVKIGKNYRLLVGDSVLVKLPEELVDNSKKIFFFGRSKYKLN